MKVQMKLNQWAQQQTAMKSILTRPRWTKQLQRLVADFRKNADLYKDLAFLEPRRFSEVQKQLRNDATLLSKIEKMSEVSLEQLREESQPFSQVYKEISSTAMIKMATSIPKEESFKEYMEISEHLKEEGFIAEVPTGTTALVSTDTVASSLKK